MAPRMELGTRGVVWAAVIAAITSAPAAEAQRRRRVDPVGPSVEAYASYGFPFGPVWNRFDGTEQQLNEVFSGAGAVGLGAGWTIGRFYLGGFAHLGAPVLLDRCEWPGCSENTSLSRFGGEVRYRFPGVHTWATWIGLGASTESVRASSTSQDPLFPGAFSISLQGWTVNGSVALEYTPLGHLTFGPWLSLAGGNYFTAFPHFVQSDPHFWMFVGLRAQFSPFISARSRP